VTVGSIVTGAFRLVRERPDAIAVWGLFYLLMSFLFMLAMRPFLAAQAAGGAAAVGAVQSMIGLLFLLNLIYILLLLVLYTGALRAVLRPDPPGFFHLRLGIDELHIVILGFGLAIAFYLAFIILALVVALLAVAVGAAGGTPAAMLVAAVCGIALFGVVIWLEVRLSLAFPLTVMRRRMIIGESWRLTRGRFWTLFGAYFCLFLIVLALWTGAALLGSGSYLAAVVHGGFDPIALREAQQEQVARQLALDPVMLLAMVVGAIVGALSLALFAGAAATAARELTFDADEIAETFA
jgi:hypothetical protein